MLKCNVTAAGGALSLVATAALLVLAAALPRAQAADGGLRLIMVDDPNCSYCRKWDAEVGRHYESSAAGSRAPLVRLRRGDPALQAFKVATYTPTFILAGSRGEVGRIVGYPGRKYFWSELAELIEEAGPGGAEPPAAPPRADAERGPGGASAEGPPVTTARHAARPD